MDFGQRQWLALVPLGNFTVIHDGTSKETAPICYDGLGYWPYEGSIDLILKSD
jgi:hypothetical protein